MHSKKTMYLYLQKKKFYNLKWREQLSKVQFAIKINKKNGTAAAVLAGRANQQQGTLK